MLNFTYEQRREAVLEIIHEQRAANARKAAAKCRKETLFEVASAAMLAALALGLFISIAIST